MNKILLALLPVLLSLTLSGQAQVLQIKPEKPGAGKLVEIIYSPASIIAQEASLKIRILNYSNYKWSADTLLLNRKQDSFTSSYTLPQQSAFTFINVLGHNSPEATISFYPVSRKGKKLPGANIAYVTSRMKSAPDNRRWFGTEAMRTEVNSIPTDSLSLLLNEELKNKVSDPAKYFTTYIAMQRAINGGNFKTLAPGILQPIFNKAEQLSEEEAGDLHRLYKHELKDTLKADQLELKIRQKYPRGNFVRFAAFQSAMSAKNNAELIRKAEQFLRDYPANGATATGNSAKFMYYSVYRNLGTAYFESGDLQKFHELAAKVDFQTANEISRWNLFRAYTFKTRDLSILQISSEAYLKELLKKVNDGSYIGEGFATTQQAMENARKQLDDRLNLHIDILYDLKKYEEALEYVSYRSDSSRYAESDLNEKHLNMLLALGRNNEVLPMLETSVRANAVTPAMFKKLKEIYTSKNNGIKGYEEYLISLKSPAELEQLKEYVKKHLTNQEYIPFALEDQNGKLVRSSDWEGKIVVIDFWATWCKPCIAAFPGMQMLVDAFAKDPKVDVYFIGTMQSGDYKQKSEGYLRQEGYRFKLLHDGVNDKNGEQDAVFRTFAPFFGSSAIPRKVILKDGIMRYTSEGYSGSPSKLYDEISMAVELLKKE